MWSFLHLRNLHKLHNLRQKKTSFHRRLLYNLPVHPLHTINKIYKYNQAIQGKY